jgi:hypothetical protein
MGLKMKDGSTMDRRDFLRAATASAMVLSSGCGRKTPERARVVSVRQSDDIRLRVLHYAVLAPSSHNSQPWAVEMTPAGMKLFVDRSRLLPASDPPARQTHISQGTFLELLEIAARQFGYRAEIACFPEGEYGDPTVDERPVAAISLQPDPKATPDRLFAEIPRRQTNRRAFNLHQPVTAVELTAIRSAPGTGDLLWWTSDNEAERQTVAGICKGAMAIEVSSPERNRETAAWFRFSDRELAEKRDGFGLAQGGAEGVSKWFVETFVLSRSRANAPAGAFARGAIDQTGEQGGSAPVFAALISSTNTRLEQVLVGRAYARVHLTASRLGLAMQPLSQALEEYPQMASLQQRLKQTLKVRDGQTVQMLFRLGHAIPTDFGPRRDAAALIRQRMAS